MSYELERLLQERGKTDLLDQVRRSGVFGLNVLASDQSELALAFARKGGASKFRAIEWELHSGLPRLPGAEEHSSSPPTWARPSAPSRGAS